ncbi:cytochrome a-5 [Diaporthe helianthi]|uniref:Cytochrome a-5 n=1 Tax=Diaporthe helianthi TaxID=158607 RepID=A0A2P5I0W4_DIAHE|nr:cytochrome a-5 [Diaporthe helianthi]
MPMLERTAASLEPCNFQRVLPTKTISLKSHRRLHTAFWHHGAAELELSGVWQALVRDPLESLNILSVPRHLRAEPLIASTFLLDFFNPQNAASLLRRLSPSVLDKHERRRLYLSGAVPRLFTSSAASAQKPQPQPQAEEVPATLAVGQESTGDALALEDEGLDEEYQDYEDYEDEYGDINSSAVAKAAARPARPATQSTWKPRSEQLHDILQSGDPYELNKAWRLYHGIKEKKRRRAVRDEFLDYATKCRSMEQLLALAIKFSNWNTFGDLWERYPDAHLADAEDLNWEDMESVLSMEEIAIGIKALVFRIDMASPAIVRDDPEFSKSLLDRMIIPCIRKYWRELKADDLALMLHLLKDHLLYEDLICRSKELGPALSVKLYKQYRKIPGVKLRGHVMREMMKKVFFPADDAAGMEMMRKDWLTRFNRLDIPSYRLYMTFYARRGDAKTVHRLWETYTADYPDRKSPVGVQDPEYLPLLHVQAVRGELDEVRRVFDRLQNDYGTDLPVICWNVLLNAHAKAGEYDTAIRVFTVLQDTCKPDQYSYGTMMGMSGARGDLEFTLELYRMAKNDGVEPNITMIDDVVEAYCQNDRYSDAERICLMTTRAHKFKPAEFTVLWNSLLYHHASRRDLTAVNRLLVAMTDNEVPYDNETYDHLLRGLAISKQPHHALYLLKSAVRNHAFKPTVRHYALLMSAFMQSGQPLEALQSSTILRDLGVQQSNEAMVRVFKALGSVAQASPGEHDDKQHSLLTSALRQFREAMDPASRRKRRPQRGDAWVQTLHFPDTVTNRTDLASVLIFIFTQMRQTMAIPEILRLWRNSSPEAMSRAEPPLRLLDGLMLSAFHDGNYDEVKDIWSMIFDRALQMAHVGAPGTARDEPLPSMRYMLTTPLKTMQRVYAAQGDPDSLRQLISSVLQAKFRLDSKNWNYYIQFLASMKKFREAFIVCEEQLMPHWFGWQRVRRAVPDAKTRLPLDMRRKGSSPRANRPSTHTLLTLTKAYMDLEQMAAWSPEADRLLAYIVDKCPGVMTAVRSLIRTDDETERKHLLSEKQLQIEEDMRKEQLVRERLGDRADEPVPQAFLDMMELAGEGQGSRVEQESWDGGANNKAEAVVADDDDGDSQWSDVQDSAGDDDWAPKQPASPVSRGDNHPEDMRKAEDAIFQTRPPALFSSDSGRSSQSPKPGGSKRGGGKDD